MRPCVMELNLVELMDTSAELVSWTTFILACLDSMITHHRYPSIIIIALQYYDRQPTEPQTHRFHNLHDPASDFKGSKAFGREPRVIVLGIVQTHFLLPYVVS